MSLITILYTFPNQISSPVCRLQLPFPFDHESPQHKVRLPCMGFKQKTQDFVERLCSQDVPSFKLHVQPYGVTFPLLRPVM